MVAKIRSVPDVGATEDSRFSKKRLVSTVNRFTLLRKAELCVRQEMVLNAADLFAALELMKSVMQTIVADSVDRAMSGYPTDEKQEVSKESVWARDRMLSDSEHVEHAIREGMRLVMSGDVVTADQLGGVLASLEKVDEEDVDGA